jgi:glycosyltransferase involved in cell wall biosynthesis
MSIKNQNFTDYKVYLVDDLSTDNTVNKVNDLINGDDRFILISNTEKKFKLRNMDELFRDNNLFEDEDIIVELDGDDWLYDDNVLDFINSKYESIDHPHPARVGAQIL